MATDFRINNLIAKGASFTARPTVNGSGVLLIGDSATGSFLTTGAADVRYVEITDSPVYKTGDQTISGTKTFAKDIVVNSVSFGRGLGNISTNLAIGETSLYSNISGTYNTAIGTACLFSNIYGNNNLGIGANALINLSDGSSNLAIGDGAGALSYNYDDGGTYGLESINNSLLIGRGVTSYDYASNTNSIVIGNDAGGMGSNSAVFGNDSIANTYLKGVVQIQRSIYGSVTNYERIAMRWNDITGTIGTSKNGVAIARPLALETNGTARMIITTGGNIGIGTTTPTEKLEVIGNTKASGILLSDSVNFNNNAYLYSDGANILAQRNITNAQTSRIYNTYTNNNNFERLNLRWDTSVAKIGTEKGISGGLARDLVLETSGTARMIISASGNVSNLALFSTNGFAYTGIAPATTGDAGVSGQMAFSSNFLYRHNGTNWQRTGIGFANW